jgi:iron complex outermembrane recepter protein
MRRLDGRSPASFRQARIPVWQAVIGATGVVLGAVTEAAEPPRPATEPVVLEEIVVTATKREVRLQEIPQAITAITAERLEELNAQSFEDYFRDVPGLGVVTPAPGKRDYSLRGVSSGQISTSNNVDISTVSQYFDEIPVTASGFQMDPRLVDIERIEVLRGPQGTYYGEGALGGMVRTITRKPRLGHFAGALEGRLAGTEKGDTSSNASAMLNLPLGASAALRLNGFYAEDGGYIDAVDLDRSGGIVRKHREDTNSARSSGYRGVLLVEPTEQLSIQAQAVHFEADETAGVYESEIGDLLLGVRPCPPAPPAPPGPGPAPPLAIQCEGGTFATFDRTASLYNLTLSGDLGWASLVSSSSYASTEAQMGEDNVYTAADDRPATSLTMLVQERTGFTQEVRLVSSKEWSQRWDYVLGAYFQNKETVYDYPDVMPHTQTLDTKEAALFADAGYMLTDQWQVRLGLRASDISNESVMDIPASPAYPNGRHIPTDAGFNPLSGRAVLTYFVTPQLMTYTSVARGFRNGTLNDTTLNFSEIAALPGFTRIPEHSEPDTNTTYELGWKLTFPARKAMLNGTLYHSDWQDMQVVSFASSSNPNGPNIMPGALPAYVNAPRARIDGFELEASVELLRGLQLRGSWSLIDAVLTEDFSLNLQDLGGQLHARKGDRIPFVARRSGSVSLNYRQPVFGAFDGFVIVNGQYQGPRTTDFNEVLNSTPADGGTSPVPFTTYFELESYWTTGLQIGIQNARWRGALYVDNVLDDRADLFHTLARVTNRPRTVGIFIRRNFE